jgi:phosphorylcholine metabolism protein LicD
MLDMVLINPIAIAARDNLKDFKEIADKAGMRFMLMEGNLLGAYRDGGIIEGDEDDMDLGIMDNEFSKFPQVIDELLKKGFVERKRVVINNELHGGCWERNGNHIDIMKMITDDAVYNYGEMGRIRYDYPKDIFETYSKITFLGMEVETVGNIEKYLEVRYGDWKTPVSGKEYDYKNPKYSPNVKIL